MRGTLLSKYPSDSVPRVVGVARRVNSSPEPSMDIPYKPVSRLRKLALTQELPSLPDPSTNLIPKPQTLKSLTIGRCLLQGSRKSGLSAYP